MTTSASIIRRFPNNFRDFAKNQAFSQLFLGNRQHYQRGRGESPEKRRAKTGKFAFFWEKPAFSLKKGVELNKEPEKQQDLDEMEARLQKLMN